MRIPSREGSRPRRVLGRVAISIGVIVAAGAIGWASATVFAPHQLLKSGPKFTYVAVSKGEVSSSIALSTLAQWNPTPVGSNLATGIVTTVDFTSGNVASQGTRLYSVNLRPVIIAQGAIPSFEQLSAGAEGADVIQVQRMLSALGLYKAAADGKWRSAMTAAVKLWQRQVGLPVDGVVRREDIVFVPDLPARVALDTKTLSRGASVVGGESVVSELTTPAFVIPVGVSQAPLITTGTRVEITNPTHGTWQGYVVDQVTDTDGNILVRLAGKDGAAICGDECGTLPIDAKTSLSSRVITAEPKSGLVVPSASIVTAASGNAAVIDRRGQLHPIKIVESAQGVSVITGAPLGLPVRIPASRN